LYKKGATKMALENILGITDSAELAREEKNESARRKRLLCLKAGFLTPLRLESLQVFQKYTHIFFLIYTSLREKSEM